jgi:hypothetical protein
MCGVKMRVSVKRLALMLAWSLYAAVSPSVRAGINERVFVIDFSNLQVAKQQAQALQDELSKPDQVITLNLAIIPEMVDDKPDYHVKRTAVKSRVRKPVKCDNGWERFGPATAVFDFEFGTVNPHLLLSVRHASPLQAPFHTVACEYIPAGPDAPQLVFKGTFAKSIISVPTAFDIELRPVNPQ